MSRNVIPFPLGSSFRQGVPGWTTVSQEEIMGLPGTEVEINNRTYGGRIVLRALRYSGSSNVTVSAGQLLAVDSSGRQFSGLTSAATDFAYPASPFITGSLTVVPGDVIWAVVSGNILVRKTTGAGTAINAGKLVSPSTTAGLAQQASSGNRAFGVSLAAAGTSDSTVLVAVGQNWAEEAA